MSPSPDVFNFAVLGLILSWSLAIFFLQPETIYGPNNSFKGKTFNFWLAYWFAAFSFYLLEYLTKAQFQSSPKQKFLVLSLNLIFTDVNSILLLGVYSSYTRAKDFLIGRFLRVWIPLWGVLALYYLTWVVIGSDFTAIPAETISFLMITPSLSLAMLGTYCLGWGFHRRLGKGAIPFPIVSVFWALIQMPLYYLFWVKGDQDLGAKFIWPLISLKIVVGVMFFTYIAFPAESQESVIRPSENIPFPKAVKRTLLWLSTAAGSLLALMKIVELISDALSK